MAKKTAKVDANPPESEGGSGGLSNLRERGRADTALIERALREEWDIPQKLRGPIIKRQVSIATDLKISPREATSAAKTLLLANRQNMDKQRLALEVAGVIGSGRDPFDGMPTTAVAAVTQVHIHLPDNTRAPVVIEQDDNSNARKTRRRRRD